MNQKLRADLILLVVLVVCLLSFIGCGQLKSSTTGGGGRSTNYTISGKVGSVTAHGLNVSAISPVTNIIAIGADNEKYMTTPDSGGNFSLPVVKGWPYAVGFYNKTGSTITLLGYLRQDQVNWHSLPLMSPSSDATSLGTVDIDSTSVEATPSVSLNDLLSGCNMDLATANLYGQSDGVMTLFTNVDVDGNGVFDFDEGKAYLLQIVIGTNMGSTSGPASGEVGKMLNQFDESYYPIPDQYQLIFHAIDAPIPADGTTGTITFPSAIYGANGIPKTSLAGAVWGASSGHVWNFMADPNTEALTQCELVSPEVVPSGSYVFTVNGKGTYTFSNVEGSPLAAVGKTDGMIYPVFKMATDSTDYVTTIYYKWMIKENGVTREATAAEVKAVIVDTQMNSTTSLIESSPSLGVVLGSYPSPTPDPNYRAPKKIDRDSNSIDVTD